MRKTLILGPSFADLDRGVNKKNSKQHRRAPMVKNRATMLSRVSRLLVRIPHFPSAIIGFRIALFPVPGTQVVSPKTMNCSDC